MRRHLRHRGIDDHSSLSLQCSSVCATGHILGLLLRVIRVALACDARTQISTSVRRLKGVPFKKTGNVLYRTDAD
jgi:hypothetical protein